MPKKVSSDFSYTLTYLTLKYERNRIFHPCRVMFDFYRQAHLTTETMGNDTHAPRKRFPIPSEMFGSPSVLEESLVGDEDCTQPLTPASAKIVYNNYFFKLLEACAINQPFRHLYSVLMKDGMTCILGVNSNTRLLQLKQGIKPVLELVAPGQAEQLWDQVNDGSIEGLSSNCKDCDEDGDVAPRTLSDSTLRNLVEAYNNAPSSKSGKEIFCRCLPEILTDIS